MPIIEPTPLTYLPVYYLDTAFITSSNPVRSVQYRTENFPAGFIKEFETTITYDNNPNPHKKLNTFKAFSPVPMPSFPFFIFDYIGPNNFVSYTIGNPFITYNNTYLGNGYIKKVTNLQPQIQVQLKD